jgi:GNAT superfamily N-acetyltransferase
MIWSLSFKADGFSCDGRKTAISPTDSPAGEIRSSERWWAAIHATVRHSLKQKSSSGIFGSVRSHCSGSLNTTGGVLEKLDYTLLTKAIEAHGTPSVFFDPAYWSRGLGTEATRLVLQFAFVELKLHRVDLRVLAFNKQAIACYEKCGFVREGVVREGALIGGEWQSDVLMSILEDEYKVVRSNTPLGPITR